MRRRKGSLRQHCRRGRGLGGRWSLHGRRGLGHGSRGALLGDNGGQILRKNFRGRGVVLLFGVVDGGARDVHRLDEVFGGRVVQLAKRDVLFLRVGQLRALHGGHHGGHGTNGLVGHAFRRFLGHGPEFLRQLLRIDGGRAGLNDGHVAAAMLENGAGKQVFAVHSQVAHGREKIDGGIAGSDVPGGEFRIPFVLDLHPGVFGQFHQRVLEDDGPRPVFLGRLQEIRGLNALIRVLSPAKKGQGSYEKEGYEPRCSVCAHKIGEYRLLARQVKKKRVMEEPFGCCKSACARGFRSGPGVSGLFLDQRHFINEERSLGPVLAFAVVDAEDRGYRILGWLHVVYRKSLPSQPRKT